MNETNKNWLLGSKPKDLSKSASFLFNKNFKANIKSMMDDYVDNDTSRQKVAVMKELADQGYSPAKPFSQTL